MEKKTTAIDGLLEIQMDRVEDHRGFFQVVFDANDLPELGMSSSFVQENHSLSVKKGTVRGLHLQVKPHEQGKLVRVLKGKIQDIIVDVRPGSATFGQHISIPLSADEPKQVWLPPGCAHGFCTLEPRTEVSYLVDARWNPESERSVAWDDPAIGISWAVDSDEATLSDKDRFASSLADFCAEIKTRC